MIRLLYQVHRWVGLVLSVFMVLWFFSGLVIIYGGNVTQSRAQQLAHAQALNPEAGWLSLGEAWQKSAEARKAGSSQEKGGEAGIANARLARIDGQPLWLVEDSRGRRLAISAVDGQLQSFSGEQAERIAQQWLASESPAQTASLPAVTYVDTLEETSTLRNYQEFKPFHRVAVNDGSGTELLISAASGEVLQAATRFDRGLALAGNWVHLFRPLDSLGYGDSRRNVLMWTVSAAFAATLTGLIIGWLRWRPGYFGKPTYPQGRTQPYRTFFLKWHFWSGLLGGTLALLWTISGILNNNPWQVFSNAAASRQEQNRYLGKDLASVVKDWHPEALSSAGRSDGVDVVELAWRRLGNQAVLLAYGRDGNRVPQNVEGAVAQFDEATLVAAAQRLGGDAKIESQTLQQEYDSYYYPRRAGQNDRPLPVLQVDLADAGHTHLYLDPQDGRLLLKQDASRRVYRWLFSAIHYWDFGWLAIRPLWDAWMVTWVSFGLVLSISSVVLGWRRLRKTFRRREEEEADSEAPAGTPQLAAVNATEA